MNSSTKQTHRHREQTCGCQGGGGWGRDGVGVLDQQMQAIILYRMDKQQGPTVQHRELYSISCDKTIMEKTMKKNIYIYIYIYLNHFAGYLTLTQHCKSTILQ